MSRKVSLFPDHDDSEKPPQEHKHRYKTDGERPERVRMCEHPCMLSQVTEHGRERYSFDPRNKERGEGKRSGETAERGARGETGQRRDERERQMALGWKGDGREAESVRQGVRTDQAS